MISFKQFLKEDDSSHLDAVAFKKLIHDNCPNNFDYVVKTNNCLWRKHNEDAQFLHFPARANARKSATGSNTLLDWASNSKDWVKFPDRKYSIMTGTSPEEIKVMAGKMFAVIPFDNIKRFGTTPLDFNFIMADDYLEGDGNGGYGISGFMEDLRTVLVLWHEHNGDTTIAAKMSNLFSMSQSEITEHINEFSKTIHRNTEAISKFRDWLLLDDDLPRGQFWDVRALNNSIEDHKDLAKFFFHVTSPEYFNAEIKTSFNQLPFSNARSEVWYTGDSLLIQISKAQQAKLETVTLGDIFTNHGLI